MRNIVPNYTHLDLASVRFRAADLTDGDVLTKFTAKGDVGSHMVEIHGFVTSNGALIITDEIVASTAEGEAQ